jgi:hypothetical protein
LIQKETAMGRKFEPEAFDAGKYDTGISVAKAIVALGWCVAGVGLFTLVQDMGDASGALKVALRGGLDVGPLFLFLLPSLGTLVGGLMLVASGQVIRAIFDGANAARQILIITRRAKSRTGSGSAPSQRQPTSDCMRGTSQLRLEVVRLYP